MREQQWALRPGFAIDSALDRAELCPYKPGSFSLIPMRTTVRQRARHRKTLRPQGQGEQNAQAEDEVGR
jgi:hypothetical protein